MGRPPTTGSGYVTTRQAAECLGVSINAIKAWIRERQLPALRTPGGHHRIAKSDLGAFQARLADIRNPRSTRPRILVVDDDEPLLEVLKEALEAVVPESVVATVTDGYEALVQVGAFRPDVLVLDIRMPLLDGFEVCRRLKSRRTSASCRILAVTAFAGAEVREAILQAGADDFLEKPFSIEKFRSRVLALVSRA